MAVDNRNFVLRMADSIDRKSKEFGIYGSVAEFATNLLPKSVNAKRKGTPFANLKDVGTSIGFYAGAGGFLKNEAKIRIDSYKKKQAALASEFPSQYYEFIDVLKNAQIYAEAAIKSMDDNYTWPDSILGISVGIKDKNINYLSDGKYGLKCLNVNIKNSSKPDETLTIYYDTACGMWTADYVGIKNHRINSKNWFDIKLKLLTLLKKNLNDNSEFIREKCPEYGQCLNVLIKGFEKVK